MESNLFASVTTAGALFSVSRFSIPFYQREYAWEKEEIEELWRDLVNNIDSPQYFLGLIILTDDENRRQVVDGQQRLLTLTLMASILHAQAEKHQRRALATRIQDDFLYSLDYATDESLPRLVVTDENDQDALEKIISGEDLYIDDQDEKSVTNKIRAAYEILTQKLSEDLKYDPFRRLGQWVEFISNRISFAVFLHPEPSSAFSVFEVINDRGRGLTTADLLKNFVIGQSTPSIRKSIYQRWQAIAKPLTQQGSNIFVQYIRHVATLDAGHIPPKDLYNYLAGRKIHRGNEFKSSDPPSPSSLLDKLENFFPLYAQIVDPTLDGPADREWLPIFSALNELNVITVRPILLAMANASDSLEGMRCILQLVLRRVVVGNLGTGNVERRFADAAQRIYSKGEWRAALDALADLDPECEDFESKVASRSYSKSTLEFLRRSENQQSITPKKDGGLFLLRPRQAQEWYEFPAEDFTAWGSTLGNTILADLERRPQGSNTWAGAKKNLLDSAADQDREELSHSDLWSKMEVMRRGKKLASSLAKVWY